MTGFGDPGDLLRSTRRVMLSGTITAATTAEASMALMYLDGLSAEPAHLMINAGGGSIDDILGLIDTLALMRAPVVVEVRGRAHGAAGLLVAGAPGERTIGPTASISLRVDGSGFTGHRVTAAVAVATAERDAESRRRLAASIGRRSGQTIDWVLDQFDRGGTFGAAEAKAAGLVDAD